MSSVNSPAQKLFSNPMNTAINGHKLTRLHTEQRMRQKGRSTESTGEEQANQWNGIGWCLKGARGGALWAT